MRVLPKKIYLTAEELDKLVKERETEAAQMLPGASKQSVLREIVQLRAYANMNRMLTSNG